MTVLAFEWGSLQWLVNGDLVPGSELTVGVCEIAAASANPRHHHPNCDEVLYVVEGALEHTVGDEVVHVQTGQAVHIPRGVPHQARNVGEGIARVVVSYSSGKRETVTVEA